MIPITFRMERDEGDIDDVYNILESYALQVHYTHDIMFSLVMHYIPKRLGRLGMRLLIHIPKYRCLSGSRSAFRWDHGIRFA